MVSDLRRSQYYKQQQQKKTQTTKSSIKYHSVSNTAEQSFIFSMLKLEMEDDAEDEGSVRRGN